MIPQCYKFARELFVSLGLRRIVRSAAGSSTRRICSSASVLWRTLLVVVAHAVLRYTISHSEGSSDTRRKEYLLGPAVFNCDIRAHDMAGIFKILAERSREYGPGDPTLRQPITGVAYCCARAASGQAAALPGINSRRLTQHLVDGDATTVSAIAHTG
jgi:hypothetical protein